EIYIPEEEKREHRAERQKNRHLGWATFWITAVTLLAVVAYAIASFKTLGVLRDQLETMDRAWIGGSIESMNVVLDEKTLSSTFDLVMTNSGRAPATHAGHLFKIQENAPRDLLAHQRVQEEECVGARNAVDKFGGDAVFPNDHAANHINVVGGAKYPSFQ